MTPLICGIQKEMMQMNLTYKSKSDSQKMNYNRKILLPLLFNIVPTVLAMAIR